MKLEGNITAWLGAMSLRPIASNTPEYRHARSLTCCPLIYCNLQRSTQTYKSTVSSCSNFPDARIAEKEPGRVNKMYANHSRFVILPWRSTRMGVCK